MSVIEIIMENIQGLSIDEIRSMMKHYENIEAYKLCDAINAYITELERERKLEELGI
jgi:hypothetical protein